MTGFKNFILRGNVVELAVALIMALAFTAVVQATVDLLMDLIGKAGGTPNFSAYNYRGIGIGDWLTAVVAFVIMAAVVYFVIVAPYTKAKERYFPSPEPGTPEDVKLLQEIRDLLAAQQGRPTP
ncbi:MscL family protein [Nocardioides caricicola]|uniref:MscL family protein n=1 Tax=Nocardioides caricicola TaxID=634770 RepID=A0ABW0N4N8_9ACTN